MSVTTITTSITKRVEITQMYDTSEVNPCKIHKVRPKLFEIFSGKKKKFQGVVSQCDGDIDEICTCYAFTDKDLLKKWNHHNPR